MELGRGSAGGTGGSVRLTGRGSVTGGKGGTGTSYCGGCGGGAALQIGGTGADARGGDADDIGFSSGTWADKWADGIVHQNEVNIRGGGTLIIYGNDIYGNGIFSSGGTSSTRISEGMRDHVMTCGGGSINVFAKNSANILIDTMIVKSVDISDDIVNKGEGSASCRDYIK